MTIKKNKFTNKYMIRQLSLEDYHKGYLDLLSQLTEVGNVSYDEFKFFYENLDKNHLVLVIEKDNKIVSTGTLLIENKLIHNCKKVGHIEDIVTHKEYRGQKLASKLISFLKNTAQQNGCYKVILNCSEKNKNFYVKKCGFIEKGLCMSEYF